MKGVALKVTYNDGEAATGLFGFKGVCTNRNIFVNVRDRSMTNCSREDSPCRQFADGNFTGKRPSDGRCYEQHLLRTIPMQFGCGFFHNGPSTDQPIPIKGVSPGDIAFLTTLLPGRSQSERILFGCFRIGSAPQFRKDWGYMLESDCTMDVVLPDDVAVQTNFWRHFQNADGSRIWGTGLFRYLAQAQTDALLNDLVGMLGDYPQRDLMLTALGPSFKARPVTRLPILNGSPLGGGGYAGGESEAHRNLKAYVAAHPSEVGLPRNAKATIEFPYLSGDQVDVKFDLHNGRYAVVEIETIDAWTGAHQCIKYRALLQAALGLQIGSDKVEAILVAHQFDAVTLAFAKQYGIRTVVLKV